MTDNTISIPVVSNSIATVAPTTTATGRKLTTYIKNDAGEFMCPHCDKVTKRQNTMYYHMKKHSGDMNHVCTLCSKGFIQKGGLQQHMAQVHPGHDTTANPYAKQTWDCPCCNHSSKMKANLLIHISRKHGSWIPPYPSDSSPCKNCNKMHASPTAYYYHALNCFAIPVEFQKSLSHLIGCGGDNQSDPGEPCSSPSPSPSV